ncbi:hypothetical protein B0I35DRAFT_465190 [Stachybotrys elegans]|uniref:Uncharacterized protein n=1 Tax=Stachybotrys elegans TaxID=80388 RepID=A0A8K0WK99_9HYPO|nr:hypothetical protein B0I35DRAFT_465190 [Stachybotrys elegans]
MASPADVDLLQQVPPSPWQGALPPSRRRTALQEVKANPQATARRPEYDSPAMDERRRCKRQRVTTTDVHNPDEPKDIAKLLPHSPCETSASTTRNLERITLPRTKCSTGKKSYKT